MITIKQLLREERGFGLIEAMALSFIGLVVAGITASMILVGIHVEAQAVERAQARAAISSEAAALLTKANVQGVGSVKVTGDAVAFPGLRQNVTLTGWTLAANGTLTAQLVSRGSGAISVGAVTGTAVMPLDGASQYTGASGARQTWTSASSSAPAIAYRVLKSVTLKGDK